MKIDSEVVEALHTLREAARHSEELSPIVAHAFTVLDERGLFEAVDDWSKSSLFAPPPEGEIAFNVSLGYVIKRADGKRDVSRIKHYLGVVAEDEETALVRARESLEDDLIQAKLFGEGETLEIISGVTSPVVR